MTEPHGPEQTDSSPLSGEVADDSVNTEWVNDGEEVEVAVRADLWVGRGSRRFVAEVKTGSMAPDPTRSATRRQLLEYLLVFEPDGLLLVDVEEGLIHEIDFPQIKR